VVIQGAAYETIPGRFPFEYGNLGEQEVKGFDQPVRVYSASLKSDTDIPQPGSPGHRTRNSIVVFAAVAIIITGIALVWFKPWEVREEPASIERMAFPLPDKPSIAVLPFTNMSGDAEQEYFVDGMTEDLITDLSQISGLFVIARNSVFIYKDKPIKIRQVAEELGVRYVLEGSVRRAADKVRINAQLIDATTGGHLWAKRYDGSLEDVFALQDDVTQRIVAALAVELTGDDVVQRDRRDSVNTAAYDAFLQGWAYFKLGTRAALAKAKPFFEEAIQLDPGYARAHAALATVYWDAYVNDWTTELGILSFEAEEGWEEHLELAMKVPNALAHTLQSRVLVSQSRYQEAVVEAEKAVALDGNKATAYAGLANALILAGKPAEGADLIRKSMRLDPHHPPGHLITLGQAQFDMEHYKAAAATFERAVKRNVDDDFPWIYLASSYGHLGRIKDADDAIESANALRAKLGESFLNIESKPQWHFHGEIDFSRSGGKQAQERLRAGLTEILALTWQNLVTHVDGVDKHWFEVKGATLIDVHTAKSLHDRGVTFVDVRPAALRSDGWIPRSVSLPVSRSNTPNNGRLTEKTLMNILDKTDEVVFYSTLPASGGYAYASAKALNWGYQNVFYFWGFPDWKEAGYPVETVK
jgi:TolB-like protein/rhodanese-related sulfurtransferase